MTERNRQQKVKLKHKRLVLDLPKIQSNTFRIHGSDGKQNISIRYTDKPFLKDKGSCLSPKSKEMRKLFFQYKSNAKILQKSPYYTNNKSRRQLIEKISGQQQQYELTPQIISEIEEKFKWNDENQAESQKQKKSIKIDLSYEGRVYNFNVKGYKCGQVLAKVRCQLAKIMYSLKNTYQKCEPSLVGFQTTNGNHQVDFVLSNSSRSITFLDNLKIKPVFFKKRLADSKISIKDFKFVKCLGSGGFSNVYLAKGNFNGKYYALKMIDKNFIIQSQREGIVENERYILGQMKSPFVTGLQFAFQSKHYFVIVIEYCPGGELFYQLKRVKRMSQKQAKFYFLQILIGLDYIHKKNIIYRDLKPENLLIGIDGHLKIADFGLSKPVNRQKKQLSYSFCGSPEYMAPEMLLKTGHNHLLDYYCLGALLYELVIGIPPYYSLDHDQIYDSILNEQLCFPDHVQISFQLKSLLCALLEKNCKKRLGSMFGVNEVLLHPWVGKCKRSMIENKQLLPPFLPDLEAFNFDLSDIKTDQGAITKKIEQDIKCESFETYFNEEFYFQNEQFKNQKSQYQSRMVRPRKRSSRQASETIQSKTVDTSLVKIKKNSLSTSKSSLNILVVKNSPTNLIQCSLNKKWNKSQQFTTRHVKKAAFTATGVSFTQRKK